MRRLAGLLALCAIAAPTPAGAAPQPDGCSVALDAPAGTLTVTAWITPPRRPHYSLTWVTPLARPGAQLQIVPWGADSVAPPPNRTLVFITMPNSRAGDGLPRRLELRGAGDGGREAVLAHGPWLRDPYLVPISLPLGRLRRRAAGRPIGAVIADGAGRALARVAIDPALLDAPAAAIEAGQRQWDALTRVSPGACPAGTQAVNRIIVD